MKVSTECRLSVSFLIIRRQTTAPSSADPIKIIQPSANALGMYWCSALSGLLYVADSGPTVRIQAGLLRSEAIVNTDIPFLIELYAPENVQFERLQFNSFCIEFSNGKTCRVDHTESSESNGCTDLGEVEDEIHTTQADLSFSPGEIKLFRGTVRSSDTGPLEVSPNLWPVFYVLKIPPVSSVKRHL